MKKFLAISLFTLAIFALTLAPVLAQPIVDVGLTDVQQEVGFGESSLTKTIGKIIETVLGFLGLIALILFIYGGFKWMTSGGNEENVSAAKKLMSAAVVGLLIIFVAWAATRYIIDRLSEATQAACTANQVKCTEANPGRYVTCTPQKTWGTQSAACPSATRCTVGNVKDTAAALCE